MRSALGKKRTIAVRTRPVEVTEAIVFLFLANIGKTAAMGAGHATC